ncbi:MAG: DMT family transporter [Bacteroidota bacterium]
MSRTLLKAHLALFGVALIYSGNYIIAKEVMSSNVLRPLAFIVIRVVCGASLFWIFDRVFIREKVEAKDYKLLILSGLFGIALNQMFFFSGLNLTTPINASLIMTTTPILVLVASSILLNEKVTGRKLLGIGVGALGAIIIIAYGRTISFNSDGFVGDLLIFANASSFGIFLVISKPLMYKYHPITVTKWIFTFAIVFVMPFGYKQFVTTDWSAFSTLAWLGVAYVVIGTTFLAYLLNTYALSLVPPTIVSIYIYLQPFLTTTLSLALGLETINVFKILAGSLIFLGVYLVSVPKNKRKSVFSVNHLEDQPVNKEG